MKTPKEIWLERKTWVLPMLENIEEALDTINKSENLNSEALEAVVGLNDMAHDQYLLHLRSCNNNKIESNAKQVAMPHHNFPKD